MSEVTSRLDKITGLSVMNKSEAADTIASLLIAQNTSSEITSKMEKTASKLAAVQPVENIENNIKQSYAMVDSYNQYYEDYVKEMVQGAGYYWTKNGSTRKVVVDSSLRGMEYETQHVNSYQWFKTALPEVTISTALLGNLEGEALALAMAQDESDIEQWKIRIFGKEKKESEDEEKEDQDKGELEIWVGEPGKLVSDIDPNASLKANTKNKGSGQMGPIMLNFAWNEVQQNKGMEELGKPAWDQKMWSGDFLGFEPPSIRTVACVAAAAAAAIVGVVATPFTGGASTVVGAAAVTAAIGAAAIGAAITFTNECLFALLDLAGDYKTPEEIGKQLATSAATSAISILGAGAGAAVSGLSGVGGVLAKTGVNAATSVTSTVTVNAIQSGGDWKTFEKNMKSFDTWKGCISSTAGSLVTNSLNSINLGTGNLKVDGFNSGQIGSISSLNSTIGSLASTAVTFGLTGEATFNVLNISDFGAGASSGLLEVTIGGKKGFSSRIGTGGADVSRGSLMTALAGINNLKMNEKIKKAAANNNMENAATALRMQYGFGDEKQMKQLDDILNGKAVLKSGSGNGDAQTVMENGQRTVYLNKYKENMTREEKLAMGITLGHEAYRDGIVSDSQSQFNETFDAVIGHTAMAKRVQSDSAYEEIMKGIIGGNQTLKKEIDMFDEAVKNNDFSSFGEYVYDNYDYSADYWKFTKEGNVVWDGSKNLYDEDGKLLHEYQGNGGNTAALAEDLGISVDEAREMLQKAKYTWDGNKKTFVDNNGNDVKNVTSLAAVTNDSVKARYDFQHNYADKVFEKYDGSMQNALQAYVAKQLEQFDGTWDTPLSTEQLAGSLMIGSKYYEFAKEYDDAMSKYGNVGSNNITQEIYDNIYNQTGLQSNDNILYSYLENGTVSPVVGDSYITTDAFYKAGLEHLGIKEGDRHSTSLNGTAADLGTHRMNLPVVSVYESSFLINNSTGYNNGGGYYVSLYTNNLKTDYKHLFGKSNAYSTLNNLNSSGKNAGIWSFPVPSNYQIGNVGNSGSLSTAVHLHFQNTKLR